MQLLTYCGLETNAIYIGEIIALQPLDWLQNKVSNLPYLYAWLHFNTQQNED